MLTREARSALITLSVLLLLAAVWWWAILGMTEEVVVAVGVTVAVLVGIATFPRDD